MVQGRVGAEWVEDYSKRGNNWTDSKHSKTCVNRFLDEIDGITEFNFGDDLAWDQDFEKSDLPHTGNVGTASRWVESCDMVYFKGHGYYFGPTFGITNKDSGTAHYTEVHWGEKKLKWIVFDSCNVLRHWPSTFDVPVDAALYYKDDKVYFFKDDQYIRYTLGDEVDLGYPKPIAGNWHGLPSSFTSGIDAALHYGDKAYFFKGDKYARYTFGEGMDSGYPKSIAGNWRRWPSSFTSGIDAAVYRNDDKVYFFKGAQYIRHKIGDGMDSGYPRPIVGNWGWTSGFTLGISAALYKGGNKAYFFRGPRYIRYKYGEGQDAGYPKQIINGWHMWPPADGNVVTRWEPAFAGLHYILGFNSPSTAEKNQGKVFAQYLNDEYRIPIAWKKACQEIEGSDRRWAYLRAVEPGTDTENDHWISKGHVSADPRNPTAILYTEGRC